MNTKRLRLSQDLKPGDEIRVGGLLCQITEARTRFIDEVLIEGIIVGAPGRPKTIKIEMSTNQPIKLAKE